MCARSLRKKPLFRGVDFPKLSKLLSTTVLVTAVIFIVVIVNMTVVLMYKELKKIYLCFYWGGLMPSQVVTDFCTSQ